MTTKGRQSTDSKASGGRQPAVSGTQGNRGLTSPARLQGWVFPTLETDAERAWRYGVQGLHHWAGGGYTWFLDGSAMNCWKIETRRSVQAIHDAVDAQMGRRATP